MQYDNQCNLMMRRCTKAQVAELEQNGNLVSLQVRLTDCFDNLGMTDGAWSRSGRSTYS